MTEREIFFEALEMTTPEARAAYLQGACGHDVTLRRKVDELLKEHFSNDSLLAGPAWEGARAAVAESAAEGAPALMIGRYKLLEKIGEGGFGEVWMAEQREPVKRRVALKIIKLGMDSRQIVARFEAERQALAMMDHANIAKIFDAGTTDSGRPYFVMELVRGIKITEYCDQKQLPTQERLRLFILVCQAIQHAHQKGIIHRDIKPSNILVTLHDGVPVPKVIDFGIAKATQQELTDKTVFTQFQQFIGTPAYISPEQAEMSGLDIDTRADIYSLGALLYELLVGQTPFDAKEMMQGGLDSLRQIIREKEPLRPSTKLNTLQGAARITAGKRRQTDVGKLVPQLQGDLDWIVMKCLEKDRTRRYETANGLAMDIQRHLANEPVVARPPSAAYRFQKLVRRNKLAFAAAAAVATVLVFGVVASTLQAVRATRAEREQRRLRETAQKETQFIKDMLNSVAPQMALGRDTQLLREILDKTAERLNDLEGHPAMEAEFRATLGNVYSELGDYTKASVMHQAARLQREKFHGGGMTHALPGLTGRGIGLAGMLLSASLIVSVARTVRQRLRPFTFVCLPLGLSVMAMTLGILILQPNALPNLLVWCGVGVLIGGAWVIHFRGRKPPAGAEPRSFPVPLWRDGLAGVALLIALFVLFHVIENWRGRREWTRVQAELAAVGEVLDYDSFLKPPIPDEDNIMAHPYMARYFVRGAEALPISHPPYDWEVIKTSPCSLAALRNLPRRSNRRSMLEVAAEDASAEVIPLLHFSERPLAEVTLDLAKRAGLNVTFATNDWPWCSVEIRQQKGERKPRLVTRAFTNTTALRALDQLSKDFLFSPDPAKWQEDHVLALAQHPSLKEIFDWYERYRVDFHQVEEALSRRRSQLSTNSCDPTMGPIIDFKAFHQLARSYANLCKAHLLIGDRDAALNDLRLLRRLADAVPSELPNLFEAMLRVAIYHLFAATVEDTLAEGLWTESNLQTIQRLCEGVALLKGLAQSMRGGERAANLRVMQNAAKGANGGFAHILHLSTGQKLLERISPSGWIEQNYASYARLMQVHLEGYDAFNQHSDLQAVEKANFALVGELESKVSYYHPYYFFAAIAVPNFRKAQQRTAEAQTLLDEAYVACALERYRAARGNYPEALAVLIPEYVPKLPYDLFDRQSLKYRRLTPEKYCLYSIGWNAKDDNGQTELDPDKGDWVWSGVPPQ